MFLQEILLQIDITQGLWSLFIDKGLLFLAMAVAIWYLDRQLKEAREKINKGEEYNKERDKESLEITKKYIEHTVKLEMHISELRKDSKSIQELKEISNALVKDNNTLIEDIRRLTRLIESNNK